MSLLHMEQPVLGARDLGFWGGLGVLALSQLFAAAIMIPFMGAATAGVIERHGWIDATANLIGITGGSFWAANFKLRKWGIRFAELFVSGTRVMQTMPWIAAGTIGQVMAIVGVYGFLAGQSSWLDQALSKVEFPVKGPAPLLLVFGVLGAPLVEELLFRGVILQGMLRRYSVQGALTASAAIFGIAHMNAVKLPAVFLLGLTLGWLYLRCGSLWPSIAAHMINNAIAFLMGTSGKTGSMSMPLEASLAFALGAACFLYLAYRQCDHLWPMVGIRPATAA